MLNDNPLFKKKNLKEKISNHEIKCKKKARNSSCLASSQKIFNEEFTVSNLPSRIYSHLKDLTVISSKKFSQSSVKKLSL